MKSGSYWVYIMGGSGKPLYTGFTNNIIRRVWEHKKHINSGFTSKYGLNKLLFYVEFSDPSEGIAFEKQVKGWVRWRKDEVIHEMNPERVDLAAEWFDASAPAE